VDAVDRDAVVGRREMRTDPPEQTLRWLLDELEATDVVAIRSMPGGSTAAMHRVTIRPRRGPQRTVVVRRYVLGETLTETPDMVEREWHALQLVAPTRLPTPIPYAADLHASRTDVPTIVMSSLEGRPVWDGRPRQGWLDQLVDAMLEIHAVTIPARTTMPTVERYEQTVYEPPRWSRQPGIWERAFDIFHGPIPTPDWGFVHRDFHPGNTLWQHGRLTGVVDWQAACVGPASIDPGHCRMNLLFSNPRLADQLGDTWERHSALAYHPWADVVSIVGILDTFRTHRNASAAVRNIENAIARAVADLTT
jgi:aminoglycoside phosphotransferase (APT) family kinase protein